VFKNFYGGGLGTVRAFEQGSLGVVDPTGAYIGGARDSTSTPSCTSRCPAPATTSHLRIFAFADGRRQRVARGRKDHRLVSLRASAGLGLSWISPVGPLKLSWGRR
jgi:outer membrane protein insertion porin family